MTAIKNRIERLERKGGPGLIIFFLADGSDPDTPDYESAFVGGNMLTRQPGETNAAFVARTNPSRRNTATLEADTVRL